MCKTNRFLLLLKDQAFINASLLTHDLRSRVLRSIATSSLPGVPIKKNLLVLDSPFTGKAYIIFVYVFTLKLT